MSFLFFKNTILLLVITLLSCGKFSRSETKEISFNKETPNELINTKKAPVVGANQTEKYLALLKEKRVGIVANQTSVIFKNEGYTHLVDSMLTLKVNIVKVFSPEHGFRGKADAGEHVNDGLDSKTGLPIISLHGKTRKPSAEHLQSIDIMVFDIQDVGVRFYTYISTLHYVMEACAENNIPLLILDRPNPNGYYVDGPVLDIQYKSFVGMHPVALVHGMTIGEYAQMINGEKWLNEEIRSDLIIIPVQNYTHETTYSLAIKPSPNLPNDKAINLYPSLGLFEGTTINAGRGTEFQFQRYGAPFFPETNFSYTPKPNEGSKHPKFEDKLCYGIDLTNEPLLDHFTLKYLLDAYSKTPEKETFFESTFTIHAGNETLQKQIEADLSEEEIRATWQDDLMAYKAMRKQYLIYP